MDDGDDGDGVVEADRLVVANNWVSNIELFVFQIYFVKLENRGVCERRQKGTCTCTCTCIFPLCNFNNVDAFCKMNDGEGDIWSVSQPNFRLFN